MYNDAFVRFPVIETQRLILRRLELTDLDDLYTYAKDREAFQFTGGFPHEYEELRHVLKIWRDEAYASRQFIRWAIVL